MYELEHISVHTGWYYHSASLEENTIVEGDLVAVVPKWLCSTWNLRLLCWPAILDGVSEVGESWIRLCVQPECFQLGFSNG